MGVFIMRGRRLKNDQEKSYLHCFNRTAGWSGEQFFGDVEKEKMFCLVERLQKFYCIEIISFVCMSNHWHAVVCTYPELEVKRSFRAFYGNNATEPDWSDSTVVERYAKRMRDVSCFVKDLQQRFTCWFNRHHGRRGRLWADRFKSVLLEGGCALWECLKYVEMNPVRAGLCKDPADYRFCSWGRYCGSGKHPFADSFEKHLLFCVPTVGEKDVIDLTEIAKFFASELARIAASERKETPEESGKSAKAGKVQPFDLHVTRRVRYWTDGAVIGSKAFVERIATDFFGVEQVRKKRMKVSTTPSSGSSSSLIAYRQLT